jgi:membrane glycosyltransferase
MRSNSARRLTPGPRLIATPAVGRRRRLFFVLVALTRALGVGMMLDILSANGTTPLELVILALFAVTFLWIATAFWSGVIGFILQWWRRDPLSLRPLAQTAPPAAARTPLQSRTAVVMPVYNEDTARVIAGLEATYRSLRATGESGNFDFYLLSDTTSPELARAELSAWAELDRRLGRPANLFYRRRARNSGRKPGNLADFCRRWGACYEYMVVLDADSVMTGACLLELAHAMQDNPNAGLIQTVPLPVRQRTFFGRFVQFAAALHSPMLATGLSFWQCDTANYWGHNAILRVRAFTEHCGLPSLSGKPPLGGEILSHDFVEAALLRRAGWRVYLLAELAGSYEEVPSNILDYVKRDRRWAQGNLQHLRLLGARGLHGLSRLHFLLGAIAYISSLLWLVMLVLSTVDAVALALTSDTFFTGGYQLFPDWPIAKTELIFSLLGLTAVLLLLPKLLAVRLALRWRRRQFGGAARLLLGATLETVFAVLIAPVTMAFHAYFVLGILCGRPVGWDTQTREGRTVSWREAGRRTLPMALIALAWGGIAYAFAPAFFWWLPPILLGLVLAAPIVRWSSSLWLGGLTRRAGLLIAPSEVGDEPVLAELERCLQHGRGPLPQPTALPVLPPELPRPMPTQRLDYRGEARAFAASRELGK